MGDISERVTAQAPTEPAVLVVLEGGSRLGGSNRRYERRIADLAGLYHDSRAYDRYSQGRGDELAYWVEESRLDDGTGALIAGLSVLVPGTIGREFAMTRGHVHALSDRAELYVCVAGHGVMLMDDRAGETRAVELTPGRAAHIPGGWVHRSVNVGSSLFSTIFCYPADAGQDYEIIRRAGGMSRLVVTDGAGGWEVVPNDRHAGYSSTS